MAACCPAPCGMLAAAAAADHRGNTAPARHGGTGRSAHTGPFGLVARSRRRCMPSWWRHRLVPRPDITDGGDR
jgi:hypothetical protein